MPRLLIVTSLMLVFLPWRVAHTQTAQRTYTLDYELDLRGAPRTVSASVNVLQPNRELRIVRFTVDPDRFSDFSADGDLQRDGDTYEWRVPKGGGSLTWKAAITNQRSEGEYDARVTDSFALFRAEDAFPAMASVSIRGATSLASLQVKLPAKWSIATPFAKSGSRYSIVNEHRRFVRPAGWLLAGDIGLRTDAIASTRVLVAAPTGEPVRRQDILAMMNWTLPHLKRVLPDFPDRLLIVSAADPFWRGGLSGPSSLFLHADRPLVSENGTSALLHELFHVGFQRRSSGKDDWIIEGLAEYYSIELLRRSGTVTRSRHKRTMAGLLEWSKRTKSLRGAESSGSRTARAVMVLIDLDKEIRDLTSDRRSLDDLVRRLAVPIDPLGLSALQSEFQDLTGSPSRVLAAVR